MTTILKSFARNAVALTGSEFLIWALVALISIAAVAAIYAVYKMGTTETAENPFEIDGGAENEHD